jgi:hypothetical protein
LAEAINSALMHGHSALNRRTFRPARKALLFELIKTTRRKLKHERLVAAQKDPIDARVAKLSLSSEDLGRLGVLVAHTINKFLTTAICPKCSKETVLLHLLGPKGGTSAVCDKCLEGCVPKSAETPTRTVLIYYPVVIGLSAGKPTIREIIGLRMYIEACLAPMPPQLYAPLVTTHFSVLKALLSLLTQLGVQGGIQRRLSHELEQWKPPRHVWGDGVPVTRVNWKLLEPDANGWEAIAEHFRCLQKCRKERFDFDRLEKLHALKPSCIYIGMDSFEGYVVFAFESRQLAILDCPKTGNALYVMPSHRWQELSHFSKRELLSIKPDGMRRVIHNSSWYEQIALLLAIPKPTTEERANPHAPEEFLALNTPPSPD